MYTGLAGDKDFNDRSTEGQKIDNTSVAITTKMVLRSDHRIPNWRIGERWPKQNRSRLIDLCAARYSVTRHMQQSRSSHASGCRTC